MNSPRRYVRSFASAIALALVTAAWVMFAPIQVGGQAAYAIVSGNSMEPSSSSRGSGRSAAGR